MKLNFKGKKSNHSVVRLLNRNSQRLSLSNNTKTELKHYEVTWDRHAEFRHYSE